MEATLSIGSILIKSYYHIQYL